MKTTNGIVTKYVYGLSLIGEEKQGCFKTYHFDYRGSTIAITNQSGNITDTFTYDTYGKLTARTETSFVIFGYNGRDGVVTDKNGLLYMRARYYSPELRRFVNADIVAGSLDNSITLNRFVYANGNPVSFIDPFGLIAERGNYCYQIARREDINGIGLLEDGTIIAGANVTDDDVEILKKIAMMTYTGVSEDEIIKLVEEYCEKNRNTVIAKNKLLDYYTSFEDITSKLSKTMARAEYENIFSRGENYIKATWPTCLIEFYNNVRNKAKWDLKQDEEWQQSSLYYFNGELVDKDAPANIMFGYMGKAYGIPQNVLYLGAGFAQIAAGNSKLSWFSSLFDDPIDRENVIRGIEYYGEIHS